MKSLAPRTLAGLLLLGHVLITLLAWGLFVFVTSAVDDSPLNRLLQQFSAPERHPLFTVPAAISLVPSLFLALAFFSSIAGRRAGALALAVLVALHALANLAFVGVPPFVYLLLISLIAYRGYQRVAQPNA